MTRREVSLAVFVAFLVASVGDLLRKYVSLPVSRCSVSRRGKQYFDHGKVYFPLLNGQILSGKRFHAMLERIIKLTSA